MGEHYFTPRPQAPSSRRQVVLPLPDLTLRLVTDSAVFSSERVDTGTRLLLLHGPSEPPQGDVLDLGCGYGPIAITLARRSSAATVWAVDVNERALELCRENAATFGLHNVQAVRPDEVPDDVAFTAIWSNPPIRIGKAALHDVLSRWLGRLAPTGVAHLVVSKHLGADSLVRWLGEEGWTAARRASHQGYRVLDISRRG